MDRTMIPQIRLSDIPNSLDDLIRNFFGRFGNPANHVQLYYFGECQPGGTEHRIAIYTDKNQYMISAKFGNGVPGYLGCIANSRKPRAGENHTRGSDLHDGPFTYETWFRILADIVSYEMVELARSSRPVPDGYAFPSDDMAMHAQQPQRGSGDTGAPGV